MKMSELLPRKHDKWMVPMVVLMIPLLVVLFGKIVGWTVWAKSTDKDIVSCANQISLNAQHIEALEASTEILKIRSAEIKSNMKNLIDTVRASNARQEKQMDHLNKQIEKVADTVLKILQNGKGDGD